MSHDTWRPILSNPATRVRTSMRIDAEGRMIFKDEMAAADANQLADRVTEKRNENDWRHRLRRSTQNHRTHIATIPAVVVNQLMREGIWGNPERMTNWLNNPENKMWRTGGGHVKIRET
jgi:hypothetical protein